MASEQTGAPTGAIGNDRSSTPASVVNAASTPRAKPLRPRWALALAAMAALAVAMGIGRFAFTPLLPMMLADGTVDLPTASWLASSNYIGYLIGALICTFQPWIAARLRWLPALSLTAMSRGGLAATCLFTLGMGFHLPALWPLLRFAAGVASAVVFVYASAWCITQLSRRNATALAGLMFTGPGAGIAVSGLLASGMVAWGWTAATGWFLFGALAVVLTAAAWPVFSEDGAPVPAAASAARPAAPGASHRAEMALLAVAYGLAGFGYIVTATFLPVIARGAMPGSVWLDLFWPIFGGGVVIGALCATRLPTTGDLRWLLCGAYVLQALGIAASVFRPDALGFAVGSLVLGLPFTAITFFALQESRRLAPAHAASFMGLLTVLYGLGQIVGPPMVALLLRHSATPVEGFRLSLEIAAAALVAGAAMYVGMIRAFPIRKPQR
ncbi:MAG: YbfB/YjiJ family transporter [Rhizobacter sp.]|nr:YbfB/YjiJ family transporter [Rhizobacter sp.]